MCAGPLTKCDTNPALVSGLHLLALAAQSSLCFYSRDRQGALRPCRADCIPDGAVKVCFPDTYNQPVHNLPKSVQHLKVGAAFNSLITLHEGLLSVEFGAAYNQHTRLPSTLVAVKFGRSFEQKVWLPDSLRMLVFGRSYNAPTSLPPNLVLLQFGAGFNRPIVLPEGIIEVKFGTGFAQYVSVPCSLKRITVGPRAQLILPHNVVAHLHKKHGNK